MKEDKTDSASCRHQRLVNYALPGPGYLEHVRMIAEFHSGARQLWFRIDKVGQSTLPAPREGQVIPLCHLGR
jgi:hypothetical protein